MKVLFYFITKAKHLLHCASSIIMWLVAHFLDEYHFALFNVVKNVASNNSYPRRNNLTK